METLPIEIVADISMSSAKTWASMLLVFRGLRAEYFDCLARKRLIECNRIGNWRTTRINDKLHSIGDQPAKSNNDEFEHPDWDLLRGKKEPVGLPLVSAARIDYYGQFVSEKLIRSATACERYWQKNFQRIEKGTSTQTKYDHWYKNGELRRENGPHTIIYTFGSDSYFHAQTRMTYNDSPEKIVMMEGWGDTIICTFMESMHISNFGLSLDATGPQS